MTDRLTETIDETVAADIARQELLTDTDWQSLADHLNAQAGVFDNPAEYRAGVYDALAALRQHLGQRSDQQQV